MEMAGGLERFVVAQDADGTYARVLAELAAGRKRSHWMWFVFPQIAGLGSSPTAVRFAIASLAEAEAYLAHLVLGARLKECAALVDAIAERGPVEVFGAVDALKLRSSMTLFSLVTPREEIFSTVLKHFFSGERDPLTLRIVGAPADVSPRGAH